MSAVAGERRLPRRPRWRLLLELLAYNLGLLAASPFLALWVAWRVVVQRKQFGPLRSKLGLVARTPETPAPRLWLHAVSAGEVAALKPVYEALRAALPEAYIAVSTITPAGMEVARTACAAADAFFYLPFDFAPCIALALRRVRPQVIVVTERELWPNLLGLARLRGAATVSVNGWVSDRAVQRARLVGGFMRWQYRLFDSLCVQSARDVERLHELGVPAGGLVLAGPTKADTMAARDPVREQALARELGVREGEVWLVAGSTHPGEEEVVLDAFARIRGKLPAARLLLAPRHLHRVPEVCAAIARSGLRAARRSEQAPRPAGAVLVLDTMGELRDAYAVAAGAFVGGTLVPIGGHNLLEPVAAGKAVLFGPHTESCSDVAELVLAAGVGFRIAGAEAMAEAFLRLACDEAGRARVAAAGGQLIAAQQGAARRCAEVTLALLREVAS